MIVQTGSNKLRREVNRLIDAELTAMLQSFSVDKKAAVKLNETGTAPAAKGEQRWSIAANPKARLLHGWISFDETGGKPQIREHVGAVSSRSPLVEPIELVLGTQEKEGSLHLRILSQWKDKSASFASKTRYPERATLRTAKTVRFTGLTTEWKILWRTDFVRAGKIVKSVAYVARLSPMNEKSDDFGRREMVKVMEVLKNLKKVDSITGTVIGIDGKPTGGGNGVRNRLLPGGVLWPVFVGLPGVSRAALLNANCIVF